MSAQGSEAWDVYWRGTEDAAAYTAGGVSHPQIREFWDVFFHAAELEMEKPRCLDIASGGGAVVERMLSPSRASTWEPTCVDASEAAVRGIRQRFSSVCGIAADAAALPLASGAFDLVTSQFGVEYAGPSAVAEALRMVAPRGRLAFLVHRQGGSIFDECSRNLAAINELQESAFLPLALRFFEAGFAAVRGRDRSPYEQAGRAFDPAVRKLEAITGKFGPGVAGGMLGRLYEDVGRIHGAIHQHDEAEVIDWLKRLDAELAAFSGRMSSMLAAALDEQAFANWTARLVAAEFSLDRAEPLPDAATGQPLGWALIATRVRPPR